MQPPAKRTGVHELMILADFDVEAPELAQGGDGAAANGEGSRGAGPTWKERHPIQALISPEILGDATQQTLRESWNGPAYQSFREALLSTEPSKACANCGLRWSL